MDSEGCPHGISNRFHLILKEKGHYALFHGYYYDYYE